MTHDIDHMESSSAPGTDIDRSSRFIVSALFTKALSWLAFAFLVQVVVSFKLIYPAFLSSCPWVTYGKLTGVFQTAFIYGFLIQAFLGVGLWMSARLGGRFSANTGSLIIGLGGFNLALVVAVLGIMAGYQSGYDSFALPSFSIPFIIVSYGVLAFGILMNFYHRKVKELYPSQWFLLAGVVWLPWVATSAWYLLHINPVQGVMQSLVAFWFARNLTMVCLTAFGFASAFYLVPKLTGQTLKDRTLIVFGFWALVTLGGWGGVPAGAPLPAWITGLSTVAKVAFIVALIPMFVSLYNTHKDCRFCLTDPVLRWVVLGLVSLLLVVGIDILIANRLFNATLEHTLVMEARSILLLWGFGGSLVFASLYHINENLFEISLPQPRLSEWHFTFSAVGLAVSVVALSVGGFLQGLALLIPQSPFIYAVKIYKPFLWLFCMGGLVFAAAQWCAFLNMTWQWCLHYCKCCVPQSCIPKAVEPEASVEAEA